MTAERGSRSRSRRSRRPLPAQEQEERAQEEELLAIVARDRETRCRAILDEARQRAREIEREARRRALERVREVVREEREAASRRVRDAREEMTTRSRARRREASRRLLDGATARLEEELDRRWRDPDARRRWVLALARRAVDVLPAGAWRVEHAPPVASTELEALVASVASGADVELTVVDDHALRAGLRVSADGARLDATTAGLLADRSSVDARLLAELHAGGADG